MTTRIINLGSSSAGNATLYEHGNTRVLVDAGLSLRQIELRLIEVGVVPSQIEAVLITHEHLDHCQAVPMLTKKYPQIPIFCNQATAAAMSFVTADCAPHFKFFKTGSFFEINDLIIGAIAVPHAAAEAVGFSLYLDGVKAVHLTDLGHVDEFLCHEMSDADVILIESNYDPDLMVEKAAERPFEAHKRNFGRTGHLANHEAGNALNRALRGSLGDVDIALLHLSRTYNTPELALGTVRGLLEEQWPIVVTQEKLVTRVFER